MNDTQSDEMVSGGVVRQERCSLSLVRRVAAMLDQDPDVWANGDILPRGWQFLLLGADTRRSELRSDGFPGLGVPLPDLGLPRLVLGGRTVEFRGDIIVGEAYRRESRIQSLTRKESANGPLAIISIAHSLMPEIGGDAVLVETQTYVLMAAQAGSSKPSTATEPPAGRTRLVTPDDTLLFQYSALGFNSHRIHIDRTYAQEVERFPDLVVNGGLVTLLLTEFLRNELGGQLSSLKTRHLAPLFCGRPITLAAERQGETWRLRAFDDTGRLAVDIEGMA
jgi:3-methylfumaryl-CoA hydratase